MIFFKNKNVLETFEKHRISTCLNLGCGQLDEVIKVFSDLSIANPDLKITNIDILKIPLHNINTFEDGYFFHHLNSKPPFNSSMESIMSYLVDRLESQTDSLKKENFKKSIESFGNGNLKYLEDNLIKFLENDTHSYDLIIISQVLSRIWNVVDSRFHEISEILEAAICILNHEGMIYLKLNTQKDKDQFKNKHLLNIRQNYNIIYESLDNGFNKEIILGNSLPYTKS